MSNSFDDLGLLPPLQAALEALGYREPTPIQTRALPPALEGRDLLGLAQTGTGKTAAFLLPILQRLSAGAGAPVAGRAPRALVLAPTRELAAQIVERAAAYGQDLPLRAYALYGGVELGPQRAALRDGVDVAVATPGRLLDLCRRGALRLEAVEILVLDEADRLLDAGFDQEVQGILRRLTGPRQTMLFSATFPPEVERLAAALLRAPARIELAPPGASAPAELEQQVMFTRSADKLPLLTHLLASLQVERGLIFVRTRRQVDQLTANLQGAGIAVEGLHGERSQRDRADALESLRAGDLRALVATDVAARGLDIDRVSHVFNFELPRDPETYIHRIGRAGRAGNRGLAIALCDDSEGGALRDIERRLGAPLTPILDQPHHWYGAIPGSRDTASRGRRRGDRRSRGGGRRR